MNPRSYATASWAQDAATRDLQPKKTLDVKTKQRNAYDGFPGETNGDPLIKKRQGRSVPFVIPILVEHSSTT